MEKYATRPDAGKDSYEKGFVDVLDMFYLIVSGALPACGAAAFFMK
jgi:hypothetical protein